MRPVLIACLLLVLACGSPRAKHRRDETDPGGSGGGPGAGAPLVCGNAVREADEECDLGPLNGIDPRCSEECEATSCGDGEVQHGEDCDDGDGNSVAPDACRPGCKAASCGDGVVDPGSEEACDDGNERSGDGCSSVCTVEVPEPTTVTFEFRGVVNRVNDDYGELDGLVLLGDPVIAELTYDPATPPSEPGVFDVRGPGARFRIWLAGRIFETDPRAPGLRFQIINDGMEGERGDLIDMHCLDGVLSNDDMKLEQLELVLGDPSGKALSGTALPAEPPDLRDYEHRGIVIYGRDSQTNVQVKLESVRRL